MRLSKIAIEGFRGFAQERSFDLDADTVIIVGANGRGKTSLFDAVLWGLCGSIPRLQGEDTKVISLYSESGTCRVRLELQSKAAEQCVIIRSSDGKKQRLSIDVDGATFVDTEAKYYLLKRLWPEALTAEDSESALTTAITRSIYLQQDLVRQFVETDEQVRFNAVSELVGAGRVTELQLEFESARTAWTRATNTQEREAADIRDRLTLLDTQLTRLADMSPQDNLATEKSWSTWWKKIGELGVELSAPTIASTEAPSFVDMAIKQLRELRRSNDRQRSLCKDMISEIQARKPPVSIQNIDSLLKTYELAEQKLQAIRRALKEAEEGAAETRRAQLERREKSEELKVLAQLALRHLGKTCPVCGQKHDMETTRRRLEELVTVPTEEAVTVDDAALKIAADLEQQEKICIDVKAELDQNEKTEREYRNWVSTRDSRLNEIGIHFENDAEITEKLTALNDDLENKNEKMVDLTEQGEHLALKLAQIAEVARRSELEQELAKTRDEMQKREDEIIGRKKTGDLAARILEGLRDASYFVVEEQLKSIEPVLRRIYTMVDPHPAFKDVRFVTRFARGRGRLSTEIDDSHAGLSTGSPWAVLSSSQMNALAVAVFLSFNLGMPKLPIETAMLDDPLQSLDDINLLGLIDLLRRTKDERQLIVSTHDPRFGHLLQRKLRPINERQRTITIEFTGWTRRGPDYRVEDITPDLKPMRIAVT